MFPYTRGTKVKKRASLYFFSFHHAEYFFLSVHFIVNPSHLSRFRSRLPRLSMFVQYCTVDEIEREEDRESGRGRGNIRNISNFPQTNVCIPVIFHPK